MYARTSKPQEGFTCKDSHAKCFKTTNSTAKLYRGAMYRGEVLSIEIINNTRGGIVIFFTDNKRERVYWGANSSPGGRARRLLAELMLPYQPP